MKKRKIVLIILINLFILGTPLTIYYLFGLHDHVYIKTGELVDEKTDPNVKTPGLYVKSTTKYGGHSYCRLQGGLDRLNSDFSGEYELGDRVWILYYSSPRLMWPEEAHLIYIKKL